MGLYGADVHRSSEEAPGVVRGSPRRGWPQRGVAASGDALYCTVVCHGLGITLQF